MNNLINISEVSFTLLDLMSKAGILEVEIVHRYIMEELVEPTMEICDEKGIYSLHVVVYSDFDEFKRHELTWDSLKSPNRYVDRDVLAYDGVKVQDKVTLTLSDMCVRNVIEGDEQSLSLMLYSITDTQMFKFVEDCLVLYIPKDYVKVILGIDNKFYKIVEG